MTNTHFALTFGKLSPTLIENSHTGDLIEEGDALLETVNNVLSEADDPIVQFTQSVTVEFDGDLDEPEHFDTIQLSGFTAPNHYSEQSAPTQISPSMAPQ